MSRIRTIKPEFWKHEVLSELPCDAHMLAAALLNYADDEGYFNANPKLVQAECCPLRNVKVPECLKQLSQIGYVEFGVSEDGRRYGHIVNFLDHQRIDRPKASKIKELNLAWEASTTARRSIDDQSLLEGKGTGNREQGREHGTVEREKKKGFQEEFEKTFWPAYPHKVAKPDAQTSFLKAREKVPLDAIMRGLERYKLNKPPDQKWCNPTTWLNQERWGDEPALVVDAPKLSRTQHAIGKLREKHGNVIGFGRSELCDERRQLPAVQLSAAGSRPGDLRQSANRAVCGPTEIDLEADAEPS